MTGCTWRESTFVTFDARRWMGYPLCAGRDEVSSALSKMHERRGGKCLEPFFGTLADVSFAVSAGCDTEALMRRVVKLLDRKFLHPWHRVLPKEAVR